MATVLVTGFDPFGGETVNPAYEAVKLLPGEIAGARIVKQEIPTAFTRSAVAIEQALERAVVHGRGDEPSRGRGVRAEPVGQGQLLGHGMDLGGG